MAAERGRDRRFRHELFPKGAPLVHLADAVVAGLLAYEEREGLRRRRRKPDAQAAMVSAVHVIVANLAHAVLFPPEDGAGLILPTGHPREQQAEPPPKGFGKGLPGVVEGLSAIGVLIVNRPAHARLATTIAPANSFRRKVLAAGVSGDDLGRRNARDRLRLSRRHRDGTRTHLPTPDTPEAWLLREQVDTINRGLAEAGMAYVGNVPVDVGDRLMVRHFSHPAGVDAPTLDYGGRLFGGFWQNMSRERRRHIRVNGEPLAELDYGQVFPRLAYALAGASPPDGDLYFLPDLEAEACTSGEYRDGVKRGFNALIWGAKRWSAEIAALLPRTWPASRLRRVLAEQHPAIADLLQPDALPGHRLSRMESDIIVTVVLACIGQGIIVLPIHDAVLAPVSAIAPVREIMADAALAVTGASLPIALKA